MTIRILATGGCIDQNYDPVKGAPVFTKTHLPEILRRVRAKTSVRFETLMLKPSSKLTASDRRLILARCTKTKEKIS